MIAILASLLLAAPTSGAHLGLSVGGGLSHDFVGAQIELRIDHLALLAGAGLPNLSAFAQDERVSASVTFGTRYFLGDRGDSWFLSGTWFMQSHQDAEPLETANVLQHDNAASLVAGYRFKWDYFFIDAGAGGGLLFRSSQGYRARLIPDVTLALGWEL
jgi:hypothetical protein